MRIRFLAVVELDDDGGVSPDRIFDAFQEMVESMGTATVERATVSDLDVYSPDDDAIDSDSFDKFVCPLEVED